MGHVNCAGQGVEQRKNPPVPQQRLQGDNLCDPGLVKHTSQPHRLARRGPAPAVVVTCWMWQTRGVRIDRQVVQR